MNVYTHYQQSKDAKNGFRYRTLLQFGTSFQVIGSVVMKNPGTARPIKMVSDDAILTNLRTFDNKSDNWYEFSADATMGCVAQLFALYYGTPVKDLEGVIQIFNLFYVKEGNLGKAIEKDAVMGFPSRFVSEEEMIDFDISCLKPPIYLGFGSLAHNAIYAQRARRFFEISRDVHGMKYLNGNFEENAFIHPLYLLRYGKNNPDCKRVLQQFLQNTFACITP